MSAGAGGDLQTACKHFRRATEIAPDEPYPRYELGYTLFLLGECSAALCELKRTNELSPGFFLVQTEIYMCEGVLSGQLDDDTLSKLRRLQQLTDTGQSHSREAVVLSQEAIEAAPSCALGYFYLGKALFHADRARSETALKRCMELSPDDTTAIDALSHIGLHRKAAGDLESARRIWTEVVNTYHGNPHTKLTEMSLGKGGSA
jgi:Flp pilus assembly protein TadD